jgi:hypothetical protein
MNAVNTVVRKTGAHAGSGEESNQDESNQPAPFSWCSRNECRRLAPAGASGGAGDAIHSSEANGSRMIEDYVVGRHLNLFIGFQAEHTFEFLIAQLIYRIGARRNQLLRKRIGLLYLAEGKICSCQVVNGACRTWINAVS